MATAIASTTAWVRYRWTRKCLPLNVAMDVNQPTSQAVSPENGGHRNRRPARSSTRPFTTLTEPNASSAPTGELGSSLIKARFLALKRTIVRTASTDRRRFETKLRRSFITVYNASMHLKLAEADRPLNGARAHPGRKSSAPTRIQPRRCRETRSRSRCLQAGPRAVAGSAKPRPT
jgi:hypothetical protein